MCRSTQQTHKRPCEKLRRVNRECFRPLLPAWEIFRYNVLEPHGGPELYGVEPASFYAVNSLLNFNGAAPLAALTPAVLAVAAVCVGKFRVLSKQLKYLAALYIWFLFFSSLPHKEERFLCPVYPLICLAAAATLRVLAVGGEGLLTRCGVSRDFASALMSLSWKGALPCSNDCASLAVCHAA